MKAAEIVESHRLRNRIETVGMIVLFVFYAAFTWCYIRRVGTILNLNSDTAAEVMYYLAATEQGTIAPEGWMGGSMLHANALFLYPATWIFGQNLVLCWNVMSFIVTVIFYASIVFFTRSVFLNNSWLLIIPVLFSTIFPQMTRLYVIYAEYSVGMTLTLLFMSFFVRATRKTESTNKLLFTSSLLVLFFACIIGTQGIQMITFPVIGALVLKMCLEWTKREKKRNDRIHFWNSHKLIITSVVLVGIVSIAGLLIYKILIQKMFGINGLTKIFQLKSENEFKNLGNLAVQSVQGWLYEDNLDYSNTIQNIRHIFRAVGSILLIFVFPLISNFKKSYKVEHGEIIDSKTFIGRIALISFLEIMLIFLFSKAYTAGHQVRYFTNPFFLMACIGVNFIYEKITRENAFKRNTLVIISVITILVNASSMYMTRNAFQDHYKKLTGIGEYLIKHDLTFGYSSYWNASVNRMIMNDKLKILNLSLIGRTIEVQGWYTCKKWYQPTYHEGKSFLMLSDTEYQNEYWHDFAMNLCGKPVEELKYEGKNILVYDYNIAEVLPPIKPYVY